MKTNQKASNKPDESQVTQTSPTLIEQTAAKTGDYLIKRAKKQLNKILFEPNKIEESQSRINLVIERYDLQKSTFSKLSDWYTERPFWQKLAMATAIIGAAVLSGLVVHVALTALFATVAIGFCMTAHIALKEHAQSTSACNEKLCEDLRVLEDKLKSTFSTLASNNVHLTEDEQQLRSELTQLSQQIDGLSQTNTDLTGITKQLQELNQGFDVVK